MAMKSEYKSYENSNLITYVICLRLIQLYAAEYSGDNR